MFLSVIFRNLQNWIVYYHYNSETPSSASTVRCILKRIWMGVSVGWVEINVVLSRLSLRKGNNWNLNNQHLKLCELIKWWVKIFTWCLNSKRSCGQNYDCHKCCKCIRKYTSRICIDGKIVIPIILTSTVNKFTKINSAQIDKGLALRSWGRRIKCRQALIDFWVRTKVPDSRLGYHSSLWL